jgi:hypothetical protein
MNKDQSNLQKLDGYISNLGWFTGTVKLLITLENEFEGFYGKASEAWETRIQIEVQSPDETICPNLNIVGDRYDRIDDVAKKILDCIEKWKIEKVTYKGDLK